MSIHVIGCDGGIFPGSQTTCLRLSPSVLIDAGSVATLPFQEQCKIRDIFLTHSHLDHIKDLAFLADNLLGKVPYVTIHALPEVHHVLREHFFNGKVWPDFTRLPDAKQAFYRLQDLQVEKKVKLSDDLWLTPVAVDHAVPAVGYIIESQGRATVFSGDTGPTERLWHVTRDLPQVDRVIIEVAFPNAMQSIADSAKHFTPSTLALELKKFVRKNMPVYLFHLKPRYAEEIQREIREVSREHEKGPLSVSLKLLKNGEEL